MYCLRVRRLFYTEISSEMKSIHLVRSFFYLRGVLLDSRRRLLLCTHFVSQLANTKIKFNKLSEKAQCRQSHSQKSQNCVIFSDKKREREKHLDVILRTSAPSIMAELGITESLSLYGHALIQIYNRWRCYQKWPLFKCLELYKMMIAN